MLGLLLAVILSHFLTPRLFLRLGTFHQMFEHERRLTGETHPLTDTEETQSHLHFLVPKVIMWSAGGDEPVWSITCLRRSILFPTESFYGCRSAAPRQQRKTLSLRLTLWTEPRERNVTLQPPCCTLGLLSRVCVTSACVAEGSNTPLCEIISALRILYHIAGESFFSGLVVPLRLGNGWWIISVRIQ